MKIFPFAVFLLVLAQCTSSAPAQTHMEQLLTHFPSRPDWPDTLHCYLADTVQGTFISDAVLKTVLDSARFANLHYDTGEARFKALGQFSFANGLQAALLSTEESWFGKQSLLILDPRQQKCLAVVELAHFYGGDGGQTASESWLFMEKKPLQWYLKRAEHGWIMPDDSTAEPKEYLREAGQLFQWESTKVRNVSNPDSLLFLHTYRMHRTW